jgi:type VI secretion system protein
MRERRLLERIANWSEADAERTSQTQVDILVRSVNDHLSRLLNTRQGSVPIDPHFGVPDFTNLAGVPAGVRSRTWKRRSVAWC